MIFIYLSKICESKHFTLLIITFLYIYIFFYLPKLVFQYYKISTKFTNARDRERVLNIAKLYVVYVKIFHLIRHRATLKLYG